MLTQYTGVQCVAYLTAFNLKFETPMWLCLAFSMVVKKLGVSYPLVKYSH
jgi:hypothetical protein